ncbi:MAG: TonB-dependent receptor, partial [Myxococcales bacterium]|nr:TonB-dependent receptor [Myxococcales bacterium]
TLAPERALAADLGATLQTDALTLEAVVFTQAIEQLILFVPVSAYLVEAANTGAATTRGVEASARWRPHRRVTLSAHYTFTDAHLQITPQPALPNRPRHRARAALTLSTKHVTLTPAAAWRSAATLDLLGRLKNTPFLDLQARATVHLPHRLAAHLSAENLLDRRDVLDTTQRPLPGRTLGLTLSYDR